jgi:hypothetical protein
VSRLISRTKFIPGGFRWLEPATQFAIRPWSSFDSAVQQIIAHRQGNPALTARLGWSTDYAAVSNELDSFNASICAAMQWTDYIATDSGQAVPAAPPPQPEQQKATKCCGQK